MVCQQRWLWVAWMTYGAGNALRHAPISTPHLTALVPRHQSLSPLLLVQLYNTGVVTRVINCTVGGIRPSSAYLMNRIWGVIDFPVAGRSPVRGVLQDSAWGLVAMICACCSLVYVSETRVWSWSSQTRRKRISTCNLRERESDLSINIIRTMLQVHNVDT